MLDDDIDPSMAIEMTGLQFSEKSQNAKRLDPQYLAMVNRSRQDDEELGLSSDPFVMENSGSHLGTDSSKGLQDQYEKWLVKHL